LIVTIYSGLYSLESEYMDNSDKIIDKINNDLYTFNQAMPCNLAGVTNSLHNYCVDLMKEGYGTDQINSNKSIQEYVKNIGYMVGLSL
jgi:hypothetical protein